MAGCGSANTHENDLAELKALVDHLPLPADATLVKESGYPATSASEAYLDREYRLPSDRPTQSLHTALDQAGYQIVDPHTKSPRAAAWSDSTTPDGGDVYVLPPGRTGDGIELRWQGRRLFVKVEYGQVR